MNERRERDRDPNKRESENYINSKLLINDDDPIQIRSIYGWAKEAGDK